MTKNEKKKINLKIHCTKCGGDERNHRILASHVNKWDEDLGGGSINGNETYQICQCLGCDTVRFREVTWCSEDYGGDDNTGEIVKIYPTTLKDDRPETDNSRYFPERIRIIYSETVQALNVGANILTGAGLRAIVEAICQNQEVTKGSLENKIDELRQHSFLTQSQVDLLHEERYIGNKALHEIEAPRISDLKDGLDIIEGMLTTIYVLPEKAKRLKKERTKKNKRILR
ncbi:MAG: DUF4145 domain-containing protein [Bdellovibrionia bacterium]